MRGNTGVIILAATNRPESLDPRSPAPGRFDRRVPVELPDLKGREDILKVHAKKIKVAEDVDFNKIARMASGASGAELGQHRQRSGAACRAGRAASFAHQADLEESIEVVIAGYQKKNAILTDHEKMDRRLPRDRPRAGGGAAKPLRPGAEDHHYPRTSGRAGIPCRWRRATIT